MLSVYREYGVVRKESRDDNFNKTAENRNIYQLIEPGWLVVNRMKAWQGSVGVSNYRGIVSGHYICFRPRHGEDPRFLNYLLRSPVYAAELRRLSRGVRPHQIEIDNDWLRVLPVRLPSIDTQRAIADYLDGETARLDALIEKKRWMLGLLGERRMSVMTDGVSGALTEQGLVEAELPWLRTRGANWRVARLSLLAKLGSGHTPSREHPEWWTDCYIPWITTGEVSQMRSDRVEYITQTREMISNEGLANSAAVLHPAGTVVLCRTASAGYSAIMGTDMATSQDFATWTCGPLLSPRFLLLCLRAMRQDLLGRLAMGSTHKTIYMPDIEALRIPLPSLDQQQAVVEAVWQSLNAIDSATDALNRQVDLLGDHRQSLITAAVSGELKVPGVAA